MEAPPELVHRMLKKFAARAAEQTIADLLTDDRLAVIDRVLAERTRGVIPVLDQIYDSGNISAVLRSAESMGFMECHIIGDKKRFRSSKRITQGAHRWMDIRRWTDPKNCLQTLKDRGYLICATSFENAVPIETVQFDGPIALIFGNEREGVSQEALQMADLRCYIPMVGFTRSFNVSVAAALVLHEASKSRRANGLGGDLTQTEIQGLRKFYRARSTRLYRAYGSKIHTD